jgi:hypothetical protein
VSFDLGTNLQLHKKSKEALQWAADFFIAATCTPDDGQLG